jgi:tRNA(His) 5'-end guanylyltransferase
MGQITSLAVFDARAFNIPREEVANYFLWRAKDWQRNSLQMYASSVFSHKELHGKKQPDMHDMLHDKGRDWEKDVPMQEKHGTFLVKDGRDIWNKIDILPNYEDVARLTDTFI